MRRDVTAALRLTLGHLTLRKSRLESFCVLVVGVLRRGSRDRCRAWRPGSGADPCGAWMGRLRSPCPRTGAALRAAEEQAFEPRDLVLQDLVLDPQRLVLSAQGLNANRIRRIIRL